MAAESFDRVFVVTEPEEQQRIYDVLNSNFEPIDVRPYSEAERVKAGEFVDQ